MNSNALQNVLEQTLRFSQLVGIPVMSVLVIVGLMILLTSGKNPRRKRIGYSFTIGFTFLTIVITYLPAFVLHHMGDGPRDVTGGESIEELVDSSASIGDTLFNGVKYISVPLTFYVFILGILIVLCAGKNPQRTRLGYGLMLFSPIVLGLAFTFPYFISLL